MASRKATLNRQIRKLETAAEKKKRKEREKAEIRQLEKKRDQLRKKVQGR